MDWLATGADVRLKLSQTQLLSISPDFLLCSVRQTFTAKLLFSESSNNSLYFVLDADNLPPDPPSPWKLTMYTDELFELTTKPFILDTLLNKSALIYTDCLGFVSLSGVIKAVCPILLRTSQTCYVPIARVTLMGMTMARTVLPGIE